MFEYLPLIGPVGNGHKQKGGKIDGWIREVFIQGEGYGTACTVLNQLRAWLFQK
jgi:hypothetical protein